DAGLRFQLDLVGEDTLAGAVHALADAWRLSPYVTFTGFLPHERLRPLVAAADVLLVSSRHEAGPLVALEAAVAGVPTVGTAVGHIREWAPTAAVAVPVGDAEALARETLALLGDDTRRVALAREAQRRAIEQDADWTARSVEVAYQELTARA
ncbi:MAG: glycosyltransferase, partial [Chloroflexota bacterium]|nr:glycosyltransferase [Chloroflexota bacterium]